jgi:glycosyltransferase involved in cell wall biosynthesis
MAGNGKGLELKTITWEDLVKVAGKMVKKNKVEISAILKVKNEEARIKDCLESVSWVNEVIVVDSGSTDATVQIAKKAKAKVINYPKGSYADWHNKGLENAKGEWVLYIDADERVTPLLRKEIQNVIKRADQKYSAFAIPRRNFILKKEMKHGGWWPDHVKRLFKRENLEKWVGELHEEPIYKGELGHLKHPFIHLKHDNLLDMVEKSNTWSEKEARLLYEAKHPKMSWWRFFRIMGTEFWYRMIQLRGFLDGPEGIIYALYQMWYRFLVYAKLWEMQLQSQELKVKKR